MLSLKYKNVVNEHANKKQVKANKVHFEVAIFLLFNKIGRTAENIFIKAPLHAPKRIKLTVNNVPEIP